MSVSDPPTGYLCGLPYCRLGRGPRPLVVLQGLWFENKPPSPLTMQMYRFLGADYTVYGLMRRPGLPQGCTLQDMAADCAAMIRQTFGGPVDAIGMSTGGSIVQYLAADHPDLVRRLVIHSSAYTLSEEARRLQMRVAHLAQQGRWAGAYAAMMDPMLPDTGMMRLLARPLFWLMVRLMCLRVPDDAADLMVTVEAEDRFNFRDRLAEIAAPTLVVGGTRDPFYTPDLFRETAAGIPNARLILYEGMGHPASGRPFGRDVLAFLRAG